MKTREEIEQGLNQCNLALETFEAKKTDSKGDEKAIAVIQIAVIKKQIETLKWVLDE